MGNKLNLNLLETFQKVREETVFYMECAWCGKHMGQKTGKTTAHSRKVTAAGHKVKSYGMCKECQKKAKAEYSQVAKKSHAKGETKVNVSPLKLKQIATEGK